MECDVFDEFKEEFEGFLLFLIMKYNVVFFVCVLEGKFVYFFVELYFKYNFYNMVMFSFFVLVGFYMWLLFIIYEFF